MSYYADSKAENKPEAPPMEMAVTMHNGRLYFQHARPSDAGLEFAKTAQAAADLLLSGKSVRMEYDLSAGRRVKQIVANRGSGIE